MSARRRRRRCLIFRASSPGCRSSTMCSGSWPARSLPSPRANPSCCSIAAADLDHQAALAARRSAATSDWAAARWAHEKDRSRPGAARTRCRSARYHFRPHAGREDRSAPSASIPETIDDARGASGHRHAAVLHRAGRRRHREDRAGRSGVEGRDRRRGRTSPGRAFVVDLARSAHAACVHRRLGHEPAHARRAHVEVRPGRAAGNHRRGSRAAVALRLEPARHDAARGRRHRHPPRLGRRGDVV